MIFFYSSGVNPLLPPSHLELEVAFIFEFDMRDGKNEKSFPPHKNFFGARAPKIFWSDLPDPPVSSVSFWLTPLPPLSARQFLAYPPTPLSQLVSVFGKPPPPAKVLTSFLNGP